MILTVLKVNGVIYFICSKLSEGGLGYKMAFRIIQKLSRQVMRITSVLFLAKILI